MECSLAALIACFSWSNLYLGAQLTYQDYSAPYHEWRYAGTTTSPGGLVETTYTSVISEENENPYFRPTLGFKLPFRSVDVTVGAYHQSSVSSKRDRGINGVFIDAQWFPVR